jgi:hypothetical protein
MPDALAPLPALRLVIGSTASFWLTDKFSSRYCS